MFLGYGRANCAREKMTGVEIFFWAIYGQADWRMIIFYCDSYGSIKL